MRRTQTSLLRCQSRAFTLLESLLTLFALSFILMICANSFENALDRVQAELFLLRFERIYKDTQFASMTKREANTLEIANSQISYLGKREAIPSGIYFASDYKINFNEAGGNSSLQKIELDLPKIQKKVSYQLNVGSGKYKKTVHEGLYSP